MLDEELFKDLASYGEVVFGDMNEQAREAAISKLVREAQDDAKRLSSSEAAARKLVEKINTLRSDAERPYYYLALRGRSHLLSDEQNAAQKQKKKKV